MLERIKTTFLILLIFLSVYLTWQSWTYQPHYDYILPTEYVTHEGLAEVRGTHELIRPERIIYHYGDDQHKVSYPEMFQYGVIQRQMSNWYLYNFKELEETQYEQWLELTNHYEGIELSFPTGIPFRLLKEIFNIRTEETTLPLVNRIWIYHDQLTQEVYAMFISEEGQSMVRARTGITGGELRQYLLLGESRPYYEAYQFRGKRKGDVYSIHYLPTVPTELTEYRYFYQRIPVETMIPYLFVDPTLVRQIQDRGGDGFYTDGSRGLQVSQNQIGMYYFHPLPEHLQTDIFAETYVQRSIQFVNQHKGWEQSYFLSNIDTQDPSGMIQVQFRKYLGNYPIVSKNKEEEQNVIQLDVQFDRVVGYFRPLIEIDRVMDQVKRELPPGTEVIHSLEASGFHITEIDDVYIGYRSDIQEYYVSYIPYWVIELKNGERMFIKKLDELKEEPTDELESN
jgi:regulatory protein YycH of two-component signal transduction system YycFG